MKRIIIFIIVLCLMFTGCNKKENYENKLNTVIEELVNYKNKKAVKSENIEEVKAGIYTNKDYYSLDKLEVMTFNEKVNLLEVIDINPSSVYVVIENKTVTFNNYKNITDLISNGAVAKTIISLFSEYKNIETGKLTYPNGTNLKSITITKLPKTDYNFGEPFDFTGIEVVGTNLDNSSTVLTVYKEDFTGFTSTLVGTFRINLKVLGRQTYYDINVNNVITSADFTLTAWIDFLKLKRYSATIKVSGSNVDSILLITNQGGLTPPSAKVINGIAEFPKITMDMSVTNINIIALDVDNTQIGTQKVVVIK